MTDRVYLRALGWIFEEIEEEYCGHRSIRWWAWPGYITYSMTLSRGAYREPHPWGSEEILFETHPRFQWTSLKQTPHFSVTTHPDIGSYTSYIFDPPGPEWRPQGGPGDLMAVEKDITPIPEVSFDELPKKVRDAIESGRRRLRPWGYGDRVAFVQDIPDGMSEIRHLAPH